MLLSFIIISSSNESHRMESYPGLKFNYTADGSDDETTLNNELPSCVYAAARSRLNQIPLAAYVHQHARQLHGAGK